MKKVLLFISIMTVMIPAVGFCEAYIVFRSGECRVDLNGKGEWLVADVDMELNAASLVKTGPNGVLEIEVGENRFLFEENSIVRVGDLLERIGEKKKIRWLARISKYAKTVTSGDSEYAKTSLAGIRGEQRESDEIVWFEDEDDFQASHERFEEAQAHFQQGKYGKAIPIFSELIGCEDDETLRAELAYYLGVSFFHNLRYQEAVSYLDQSLSDTHTYYFESALFHQAVSHYFLKNYREAISGFHRYENEYPEGELRRYAVFMLGKCSKEIGKYDDAKIYFNEIKLLYRDSDVYYDTLDELSQ
jgi:TolA-binding protein